MALLLASSQFALGWQTAGFVWSVDTMAWIDAFRVPATAYRAFVQHLWPAALIGIACSLFRLKLIVRRYSQAIAGILLAWALLQSLLAVAWSEDYLLWASVYRWLNSHQVFLTGAVFCCLAVLCYLQNRLLGVAVLALTVLALAVLAAARLPSAVIVPAVALASFLLLFAFEFRLARRLLAVSIIALVPPALYLLQIFSGHVAIGGSWAYLVFVLLCTGTGLIGLSLETLRFPRHSGLIDP